MPSRSVRQAQDEFNTARGVDFAGYTGTMALFIGDPLLGGIEVVGASYVRAAVTWGPPVGYDMANLFDILFPDPGGSWGLMTHMALMDGAIIREVWEIPGTDAERTITGASPAPLFPAGTVIWRKS